jgi:2'-5' RNA ligase
LAQFILSNRKVKAVEEPGIEQFPQRINIHFGIPGAMLDSVIAFNELLVHNGSWINFRMDQVPHITLIMGMVKTKENYIALENEVESVALQIEPFIMQLTKPYLQQPANRFVFSDILPDEMIKVTKQKIYHAVKPYITPDRFGGPNNHPHLTLGYFPRKKNALLPQFEWNIPNGTVTVTGISRASMHGTSLPEYKKFSLKEKD